MAWVFSGLLLLPAFNSAQDMKVVDDLEAVIKKKLASKPKFLPTIQLEKGLAERDRIVWQLYATMRRQFLNDKYPEKQGEVIPSFEEEVYARKEWFGKHLKPLKSRFDKAFREYLDGLEKTLDQGLIREYVWTFHRHKSWKQPADLKLKEFEKFKSTELKDHQPQTKAKLVMMPPTRARGIRILLDKKAMENETDGAIWLHYALMRFDYLRKNRVVPKININDLMIPSFEEEVYARQKFADDSDKHLKGQVSGFVKAYVKDLARVNKAKWMKEYVWTYYRQESWKKPEGLKLEEFQKWKVDNLKRHKPIVGAALTGL